MKAYKNKDEFHTALNAIDKINLLEGIKNLDKSTIDEAENDFRKGIEYHDNGEYEKAAYWLNMAAISDHPEAQYSLGGLFMEGDGVEKNIEKASYLFRSASANGHKRATKIFEKIMREAIPKSIDVTIKNGPKSYSIKDILKEKTIEELAEDGSAKHQSLLADQYYGERKYHKAFELYKKSSTIKESQKKLALMYHHGLGCDKNKDESVKWYNNFSFR